MIDFFVCFELVQWFCCKWTALVIKWVEARAFALSVQGHLFKSWLGQVKD